MSFIHASDVWLRASCRSGYAIAEQPSVEVKTRSIQLLLIAGRTQQLHILHLFGMKIKLNALAKDTAQSAEIRREDGRSHQGMI